MSASKLDAWQEKIFEAFGGNPEDLTFAQFSVLASKAQAGEITEKETTLMRGKFISMEERERSEFLSVVDRLTVPENRAATFIHFLTPETPVTNFWMLRMLLQEPELNAPELRRFILMWQGYRPAEEVVHPRSESFWAAKFLSDPSDRSWVLEAPPLN